MNNLLDYVWHGQVDEIQKIAVRNNKFNCSNVGTSIMQINKLQSTPTVETTNAISERRIKRFVSSPALLFNDSNDQNDPKNTRNKSVGDRRDHFADDRINSKRNSNPTIGKDDFSIQNVQEKSTIDTSLEYGQSDPEHTIQNKPRMSIIDHTSENNESQIKPTLSPFLNFKKETWQKELQELQVVFLTGSDKLDVQLLTMESFPRSIRYQIGGLVSAYAVKWLGRLRANDEDEETRDGWWLELREEIKSNAAALACTHIIGYKENCSINGDVCLLSCIGTAVQFVHEPGQR